MDMLLEKLTRPHGQEECAMSHKNSFERTKEEQLTTIAKQMTVHGIRMQSIIFRGKLTQEANRRIMDENDRLLNVFFFKRNINKNKNAGEENQLVGKKGENEEGKKVNACRNIFF